MAFAKLLKTDSVIRGGNDHYELLVFGIAPYGSSVSKELISYGSAEERLNRRVLLKENVNEAENKEQEDTTMEKDDELPIDFIVLVCSTQSKRSFDLVKEAVLAIGEDAYHFMMGKWVLVVMDPYEATRHDVSLFDIQKWALERANMPVLYCEHDVRESVKACAGRIVESAKLAMRYQNLPPVLNLCMDRSIPDQFTNEFDSVLGLAKPKASSSSSKFGATSTSSSSTNRR